MTPICTVEELFRDGRTEEGLSDLMIRQQVRAKFYLENRQAKAHTNDIYALRQMLQETIGLDVHTIFLQQFLQLFPVVQIEIAINGVGDTCTDAIILEHVAMFLTGTPFKDDEKLKALMCEQATVIWPNMATKCIRGPQPKGGM
jgi:hypothetical protein